MKIPTKRLFRPKYIILFLASLLLGLALVIQASSFEQVTVQLERDSETNAFQEIQILYDTTSKLRIEGEDFEKKLIETKDKTSVLEALEKEILKDQLLDGSIPVMGPGISLTMPQDTELVWLIDITNELFAIGAEAVSVNGVRLLNSTMGYDEIAKGIIVLNGTPIKAPYMLNAIGEPVVLENILVQPGGFIRRFKQFHKGKDIGLQKMESIVMEAVEF